MGFGDHLDTLKDKLEPVLEKVAGLKDKLAPLAEKLAPIRAKLDPVFEKLEPVRDRFNSFTKPRCKKCGSSEAQRSERNPMEKAMSMVIPLRPYRCGDCDRRFLHFTKPLFDRNRLISLAVVMLLFGLVIADQIVRRMPDEAVTPAQVASTEANPAVDGSGTGDLPIPGESPNTEKPTTEQLAEPPPDVEQPGTKPEPGEVWSPRVVAQLDRNLAKQRGENVADSAMKLPVKRDGVGVTREKKAAPPEDAPLTTAPQKTTEKPPAKSTKPAAKSGTKRFQGLEFSEDNGIFTMTFKGDVSQHKAFALKGRYVVDLPGTWSATGLKNRYPVGGSLVKQIRTSVDGGKIRLVVDLHSDQATPVITKTDDHLSLTLKP